MTAGMAQATRPNKSSKSRRDDQSDNDTGGGPSLSDRASSGMRLAGHVKKAAEGGKLRKGFSLWRASKELPVVAAGAGDLFKRHPVPIAVAAGGLVTAGVLVLALGMGAFDSDSSEQSDEQEDTEGGEAEGRAADDEQDEDDA
jgi:hypothetical protein